MKRSSQKFVAVIATIAALTSQATPVYACGGRSGLSGRFGGAGYGGRAPISHASIYSRPISYATGSYGHGYPAAAPTQPQYAAIPHPGLSSPRPAAVSPPAAPQSAAPQSAAPQSVAPQQFRPQQTSQPSIPQPMATQQAASQFSAQQTQPQQTQPQQTQPTAPSDATVAPEQSALQRLASLAEDTAPVNRSRSEPTEVPQFAPAATQDTLATPPAPPHLGIWQANLANQASVQLRLGDDGQFQWSATQQGKVSTFHGEYRLQEGRLMLVRSGDRQQLEGNWSGDAQNGFRFQLDGAQDAGLEFRRI